MPRRIAQSTLNASTIDIMNVIRQNAGYDYQQSVPEVTQVTDIPKVGEIIYGTPAFANQFINALVNRIAIVRAQSATFNNPYARLKKGYIEYGESIEDIFVNIVKAVDFNVEKGAEREFKRNLPDVRSVFHTMNWRVLYPITIQDEDLRMAFLSAQGVQDLITKIVDSVYTSAEYDEFLLFKYLMIKAIAHGQTKPMSFDATNIKDSAVKLRSISNKLPFISNNYNTALVQTNTPKERQIIFMDADFNAQFDVEVLASAFNMDKTDFMGRLHLIDDWTTFDNERFEVIRSNSDGIEEVTSAELAGMADVKAFICDENWFQVYDNNNKFTEKYVASGLYWNYFYHVWKTVSTSPFANAITLYNRSIPDVDNITATITGKEVTDDGTVITVTLDDNATARYKGACTFRQSSGFTERGIAVQPYGAFIIPASVDTFSLTVYLNLPNGVLFDSTTQLADTSEIGDTITFTPYTP